MSLPSTPDIKVKEEEPVEVDSSPPDSPASCPCSPPLKDKEVATKPVVISTPTPTIVRPGSLPLHLGYDPLHPTLPSPTSVITQAPPSNRQIGSPTGSLLSSCILLMDRPCQCCQGLQYRCLLLFRWPDLFPWCPTFLVYLAHQLTIVALFLPLATLCRQKPK